jgi:hypothetical protein
MVGIGEIYEGFASNRLEDDSDVAQAHAPAEMGYLPLSEPLVNVRATISRCLELHLVSREEHEALQAVARDTFFKERTYRQLARQVIGDGERAEQVVALLRQHTVNLKLQDARLLIEAVARTPNQRFTPDSEWTFQATDFWNAEFPGWMSGESG